MHTILGAGGQIADELARSLHALGVDDLRLASRKPVKVNDTDQLLAADLTDPAETSAAVAGSEIAYLTVGLPIDSAIWEERFPVMMANTIAACIEHGTKLVFFDNTYMYPRTADVQTEETRFAPQGRKSSVRNDIATTLLDEMAAGRIDALIARAPEFYGPGRTQSITNTMVFDRIRAGKQPLVPLSADTRRSLIWTPDASRAMALLGNTPDAFGQTWHLPIDPAPISYRTLIELASQVVARPLQPRVLPQVAFTLGGLFKPEMKETAELLPRYRVDNVFDASKFAARFPQFQPTTYVEGVAATLTQ